MGYLLFIIFIGIVIAGWLPMGGPWYHHVQRDRRNRLRHLHPPKYVDRDSDSMKRLRELEANSDNRIIIIEE